MQEKPSKKATIIEVAKRAGVSTATAGRVLGSYGYTSSEIQQRVRMAADELGYRPNRLARGFKTGKTQTIGVVVGDIESPFYASVLRGIADVARGRGIGVLVTNSDENLEREREMVQLLLEKQVDGLIVSPTQMDDAPHLELAIQSGCPVVQIDRVARRLLTDTVVLDNVGSARDGVRRLIEAGHRRIGIVAELGETSLTALTAFIRDEVSDDLLRHLHPSWQRLLGYVQAHREAAVPVNLSHVRRVGEYSAEAARAETEALLALRPRPTALFTADGLMSTGAMEAISAERIDIPRDLSMLCFDDLEWMKFIGAGMSAVAQPVHRMGKLVAELLLRRIEGEQFALQHIAHAGSFIERGSIAPPCADLGSSQ